MHQDLSLSTLIGQTLTKIENKDNKELLLTTDDGKVYHLYHNQDCCESVTIESITGDLQDLIGSPILKAEESRSKQVNPEGVNIPEYQESFTWTFYKFATIKGYVDIRWYGESNGYYSESAYFEQVLN